MTDETQDVNNRVLSGLIADHFATLFESTFEDLGAFVTPEMEAFIARGDFDPELKASIDQMFWTCAYEPLMVFRTLFAASLLTALEEGIETEPIEVLE